MLFRPQAKLYELYSPPQIDDIITNIASRREIPRAYSYFAAGAAGWDEHIQQVDQEGTPSSLTMTRTLLARNEACLDDLAAPYERVNVVDIGVGNALPIKGVIAHLLAHGKLGRYIAIDISPDMLRIAERNIQTWFGENLAFEGYQLDMTRDRFADLLMNEHGEEARATRNLLFLLGGTLQNFRDRDAPLHVIHDSMGPHDVLIHTQKLDSETTRHQFDVGIEPGGRGIPSTRRTLVDLLNIAPSLYEFEAGYDAQRHERYGRLRFKTSVTIVFDVQGDTRHVSIDKGETLLFWRASHDTAMDVMNLFNRNDFSLLQMSQTDDQEYILTVSKVR